MRVENNTLVLEPTNCMCGDGTQPTRQVCTTCDGTGRGPRGGRNGCRSCLGGCGWTWNHEVTRPCNRCGGDFLGADMEDYCDRAPDEIFETIEIRVYRSGRAQSFNESLLGLGCLWSTTDYGDHQDLSDEALVAKVRKGCTHVQATKVVRSKDDLRLPDHLGVFCNRNGYSVRPVFEEGVYGLTSERPYAEGLAVGNAVYNAGGNGTLAGIYR